MLRHTTALVAALLLLAVPTASRAADVESIVQALMRKPKARLTRCFTGAGPSRSIAIEGGETKP